MASTNSPPSPSTSYFQKTVTLLDWWLTKPQSNDHTKTLGVAGLTSQQSRAARCFSSAPILKIFDLFELETVDGVCVILQGFINRDRTLENGFSPEVFKHFFIGFPPNWKDFCPEIESAAKYVPRVQEEDGKDSIEGRDYFHEKTESSDSYTVDMGVQDCKDTMLSIENSTPLNPSSIEIPNEHIIEAGKKELCEKSPVTPEFKDDPSLEMSSIVSNTVDSSTQTMCLGVSARHTTRSMKKMDDSKISLTETGNEELCERSPVTPELKDDTSLEMSPIVSNTVDSSTRSLCLGVSSRRMTRSMKKMDGIKNSFPLVNGTSSLAEATLTDPGILGSSEILNKKAVNVVDCDMKSKSRKIDSNSSGGCGKGSNETASCSEDTVIKTESKQKRHDQNVDVITKDTRNKDDVDVSGESQIDTTIGDLEGKHIIPKCSDPLTSAGIRDVNDEIVLVRTNMKGCRNKKRTNMKGCRNKKRYRVGVTQKEGAPATHGSSSKEAIMTQDRSKTKLPVKRKLITTTTPKSAKSTSVRGKKGSKEQYGSPNILSIETFSGKKSRSGRVVLPPLEFWRNQKVVYDEDGEVCGVQEPK